MKGNLNLNQNVMFPRGGPRHGKANFYVKVDDKRPPFLFIFHKVSSVEVRKKTLTV